MYKFHNTISFPEIRMITRSQTRTKNENKMIGGLTHSQIVECLSEAVKVGVKIYIVNSEGAKVYLTRGNKRVWDSLVSAKSFVGVEHSPITSDTNGGTFTQNYGENRMSVLFGCKPTSYVNFVGIVVDACENDDLRISSWFSEKYKEAEDNKW